MTRSEQARLVDVAINTIHQLSILSMRTGADIPTIVTAWDKGARTVRADTAAFADPFSVKPSTTATLKLPDVDKLRDAIERLGIMLED